MRTFSGLAIASILTAATALAFNGTVETVTVTQTSWSTIISTLSCPAPTTVTLCNAQCASPTSAIANNANVVYQTLSECQAGQILTIEGMVTTLAQSTTLPVEKTISDLVLIPGSATDIDYSAAATVTNIVYPSSMTGSNGQVITCGNEVTTVEGNGIVLTNCPCTVQSTVLEMTATGSGAVPTALIPSTNYIVKIIYVYVIETVVSEVPTTITRTATSTLTTIQTDVETATATATTTTTIAPRPTMLTVGQVVYLLEYDTAYDGVAISNLRKRQAVSLSGISAALSGCLAQCSSQENCVAASFDENTSSCSPLSQFDTQSRSDASGVIFAIVVFRPAVSSPSVRPSTSGSSSASISLSASTILSAVTDLVSSTRPSTSAGPSASTSPSSLTSQGRPTSSADISTMRTIPVSESISRVRSSSVLYPISNSSIISTTSRSVSASSSSTVLPVTDSSITSTTSSAILSVTSPSAILTSSTRSTIIPVSNSSVASTTSTFSSSSSASIVIPVNNSSTSTISSSTTPVVPLTDCAVATGLLEYAPARSYCSSAYPLTASTSLIDTTITSIVTTSGPATTMISNVTLLPETITQTFGSSHDYDHLYFVTITETVYPTVFVRRRQALSAAQSSIFSSILARPSSDLAFLCSCLQIPTTTSITVTQTASIQTVVTPMVSNNVTVTPPVVTLKTTETATITESITTIDATVTLVETSHAVSIL
ncbi:unnamed protein product [Aureobasidium mustum]|uniref:Apple domain-containing protein n=1 Tax=Aureobasidium mustum TaxID=2773714 RepID=A0A9N8JK24_9PEZI|nr:unnamed protein product [Aureobasidium mustum]